MRVRGFVVSAFAVLLTACGPSFAPGNAPSRPCPILDAAEATAALADGAVRGEVRISANGVSTRDVGAGVVHCATYGSSTLRPCRRPVDFVIHYKPEGAEEFYVRVPANAQYRFRVGRGPNTCEIVNE